MSNKGEMNCFNCRWASVSPDDEPCSNCRGYSMWVADEGRNCDSCRWFRDSSGEAPCEDCWDFNLWEKKPVDERQAETEEYTGGSVNYYRVHVTLPTTLPEPYDAECNDIIEALDMTFAEGNAFKAIWRTAAHRQGRKKKGNNAKYDAEKVIFFGKRMLAQAIDNEGNQA